MIQVVRRTPLPLMSPRLAPSPPIQPAGTVRVYGCSVIAASVMRYVPGAIEPDGIGWGVDRGVGVGGAPEPVLAGSRL
jgi:hypothetical protein